jgi:hypothetical protein
MARVINQWPTDENGQQTQGDHIRGDAEDPVRCWCLPVATTQSNGWIIVTHNAPAPPEE